MEINPTAALAREILEVIPDDAQTTVVLDALLILFAALTESILKDRAETFGQTKGRFSNTSLH
jgi:hypothetical protein